MGYDFGADPFLFYKSIFKEAVKMKGRPNTINAFANLLSSLSLFCGFVSIVFSLEEHYTFSAWAIILSVVFDGLDGQIARLNPVPSDFGKELDSLIDVISFGIAPSILGYVFIYRDFHVWATMALFIYLFCSVMRLAKYNVTPKEKLVNYFLGLPTTISGGVLASFILVYRKEDVILAHLMPVTFFIIILILAVLMVSNIKYLNLEGIKKLLGKNVKITVLTLLILANIFTYFKREGIFAFIIFLVYLICAPFLAKRVYSK